MQKENINRERMFIALAIVGMFLISGFVALAINVPAQESGNVRSRMTYPPYPPTPVSPSDGEKGITDSQVILKWRGNIQYRGDTRDDGIDHKTIDDYWLKVSTQGPPNSDSAYGDVFDGEVGQTTSKMISVEPGLKYYWAVKAHDYDGWSAWSTESIFSTNSPPVVEIVKVTPSNPREGQEVSFKGSASDADGDDIVAYEWTSSLEDEPLGDKASIKVPSLEVGDHTIRFRAKDANGIWSDYAEYDLTVSPNTAPTPVNGITPTRTHDLQPEITWSASRDNEGDDITYHISVGSSSATPNDIVNDVTTQLNRYKIQKKLSYGEDGESKDYIVTIWCEDNYGAASKAQEFTLEIYNTKPEAPSVAIMPMDAYSNNDLAVSITKEAQDPDGDDVSYSYRWYVQKADDVTFVPQTSLNDQQLVPSRMTTAGDTWRVEVIPNDGIIDGEKGVAEITIKNRLPEITIKSPKNADKDQDGELDDENNDGVPDVSFYTNEAITFDASKSSDPDGQEITFHWDFGDDEEDTDAKVDHAYAEPGTYDVTLDVSDGMGTSEATLTVYVIYPPAEIKMTPLTDIQKVVYKGDKVNFMFRVKNVGDGPATEAKVKMYDPDGDLVYTYTVKDLAPGASKSLSTDVEAKKAGSYRVVVEDTEGNSMGTGTFFDVQFKEKPVPGVLGKTKADDRRYMTYIAVFIVILLLIFAALIYFIRKKRMDYYEDYYDEEDEEDEDEGYAPALGGMYGMNTGGYGMGMPGAGMYGQQMGMPGAGMYGGQYAALPPTGMGMGAYGQQMGNAPALPAAGMGMQQPQAQYGDVGQAPALPKPEESMFKSKSPPAQPPGFEFGMGGTPEAAAIPTDEEVPLLPEGRGDMGTTGVGDLNTSAEPMPTTPTPGVMGEEGTPSTAAPESGEAAGENGDGGLKCPYCGAPIEEGWLVCVNCKAMLK